MSFSLRIFAFLAALHCMLVLAAPLAPRQIGDLQCNIDRAGIVLKLGQAQGTAKSLAAALPGDTNVDTVQSGIAGAQGAVGVIAKALLTGQAAPADARDQVAGNLTMAIGALSGVNSTDAGAAGLLAKAGQQLNSSATFGQGVVANCK